MADISMCTNQSCPSWFRCYRAQATPSMWQSWAAFKPEANGICESFIEVAAESRKGDEP